MGQNSQLAKIHNQWENTNLFKIWRTLDFLFFPPFRTISLPKFMKKRGFNIFYTDNITSLEVISKFERQ